MKQTISKFGMIGFFIGFLTSCRIVSGIQVPPEMRTFEKIIEVPDKSKNELYVEANSWFVKTFNSAESVIEFQDKEAGKIIGKYVFSYFEGFYYYDVRQIIAVDVKDNKLRIVISDPYYKTTGYAFNANSVDSSYTPLVSQNGIYRARLEWNKLSESFKISINKNTDW
ncbi:DUF4468 domain-containing protein [Wenyingzhuangia sp. 1_MG-2023]|nr:DUF4468 domain-containing protein [Wenyingzhuangia sp. 1_MG-2023]